MPPRSRQATTEGNTARPQSDNSKGDHETEGDSVGVDDEAIAFWEDTCAAMPPMSPAAIEAVAITVRRIDLRRANGEPHRRAGVQLPRSRTRAAVRALRLLLSCPDLDSSATKVAPLPVRGSCCLASR